MVAWDSGELSARTVTRRTGSDGDNQEQSGQQAWGKRGRGESYARPASAPLYAASIMTSNVARDCSHDETLIFLLCGHSVKLRDLRQKFVKFDQNSKSTNGTLVKVPFDLDHWRRLRPRSIRTAFPSRTPTTRRNGCSTATPMVRTTRFKSLLHGYLATAGHANRFKFPDCPALGSGRS